eukprot:CAMPEP_0205945444 /NCGR_PEP_ID=MMETSP1325-20131115/66131_1 /ASSEMBLY_ACC=CAM_ASM_000708 /TAXON_ID=236786 /ORGANISM="Florenciella sp., Strain RCC1007" /LENGTH=32 /DNA_ID= /DNA_START= /DNA_END= /DNA_ORIENTATION=
MAAPPPAIAIPLGAPPLCMNSSAHCCSAITWA